jgi:hypothetical protein
MGVQPDKHTFPLLLKIFFSKNGVPNNHMICGNEIGLS